MAKAAATKERYIETVGRRKTSTARVRITHVKKAGEGAQITVNEKAYTAYFPLKQLQRIIEGPLEKASLLAEFSVSAKVVGGGIASQAGAIRHGIARALIEHAPELRKKLKKLGYLTRDPRMVERKKYGLKKARRAPQWSKR